MQYSYIHHVKKVDRLPLGLIIKCFFLVIVISYLYIELTKEQRLLESLSLTLRNISGPKSLLLFIPIILMPINWAVEALKWQVLANKVVYQTFVQSIVGVLTGLSLGFLTPQSIGEYAGRIWQIKHERRSELIGAVFLGSFMQFFISLVFGIYGFWVFIENQTHFMGTSYYNVGLSIIILTLILAVAFLLLNKYKLTLPDVVVGFFKKYLKVIYHYSKNEILKIAIFSLFRYAIFVTQFIVVLILFDVNLPFHLLFAGVSWIFAAKTIIPAFNFLSDIGVREFSALLFFDHYQVETSSIIVASLFIWAINILIPTLVGSFLVFRMRVFKK